MECKNLNKTIYAYFLMGIPKNVWTAKMIGQLVAASIDTIEEKAV